MGHADPGGVATSAGGATSPRTIVAFDRGSAVSSLASISNFTTAYGNPSIIANALSTPAAAARAPSNKRAASELTIQEESSPSPKKSFPQFSRPHSDDNSLMSGDDSNGWEKEEDRVISLITDLNRKEEKLADSLVDVVEEVHEWTLHIEEGNPDDDTGEQAATREGTQGSQKQKNTR